MLKCTQSADTSFTSSHAYVVMLTLCRELRREIIQLKRYNHKINNHPWVFTRTVLPAVYHSGDNVLIKEKNNSTFAMQSVLLKPAVIWAIKPERNDTMSAFGERPTDWSTGVTI